MNDVPVNESLDGMFGKEIARCHKQIEKAALNIAQNEAVMDILRDYEFTLKEMYKLYRAEKEEQEGRKMADYISKKELIKALETDYNSEWNGVEEYVEGARDKYDDVPTYVDRWINAQINPPIATDGEASDYVLVLRTSGRQCVCYYVYDDEGNYWCSEDEKSMYDIDEVTHWQPLPEPPKQ